MKKILFLTLLITFMNMNIGTAAGPDSENTCDSIKDSDSFRVLEIKDCHIEGILLKDLRPKFNVSGYAYYSQGKEIPFSKAEKSNNVLELYIYGENIIPLAGTLFRFNTDVRPDCLDNFETSVRGFPINVNLLVRARVNTVSSGQNVYGTTIGDFRSRFKNLMSFKIKPGFYYRHY